MKKEIKIIVIVLVIMLLITLIFRGIYYFISQTKTNNITNSRINEDNNIKEKINAVVVKVDDKKMSVIKVDNPNELIDVGFTEEGNVGYEQGQEIEIYYDGIILTSYPEQLGSVGKIEIVKEKSNTEIPEDILKYCYSSHNNVNVDIIKLTSNDIELNITDANELSYNYSHSYKIYKKVKNENYNGEGYQIGEDTTNSTSGFIRNWFRICLD